MKDFSNFFEANNLSNRMVFEARYEDISEPLNEYRTCDDDSLELLAPPSLLGVKQNGKWGWVDVDNNFVIPPIYDYGWALCYNGIIKLGKNGKEGAIYRDTLKEAFSFKYDYLSHFYQDTYLSYNQSHMCALLKPNDVFLTGYDYLGFLKEHNGKYFTYEKINWLGQRVRGEINGLTGQEIS